MRLYCYQLVFVAVTSIFPKRMPPLPWCTVILVYDAIEMRFIRFVLLFVRPHVVLENSRNFAVVNSFFGSGFMQQESCMNGLFSPAGVSKSVKDLFTNVQALKTHHCWFGCFWWQKGQWPCLSSSLPLCTTSALTDVYLINHSAIFFSILFFVSSPRGKVAAFCCLVVCNQCMEL